MDANKLIEESLKKYEKTDFLLKYKADILYKTNKKEAIKLYNSLLEDMDSEPIVFEQEYFPGEYNDNKDEPYYVEKLEGTKTKVLDTRKTEIIQHILFKKILSSQKILYIK